MRKTGARHGVREDGEPAQTVAVAVDADKNSQHALRWAADHLVSRRQIFVLLHVRRGITTIPTPTGCQVPISEVEGDVASAFLQQIDSQTKELLLPFQCFCSRRGLQSKEVILDGTDIPKAIVDFVRDLSIDNLVLGASSRNALSRTFKSDVPTSVAKAVPDFCSVYVISKGKVISRHPALHPNKHHVKQTHQFETSGSQFQSVKSEPVAGHYMQVFGRSNMALGAETGVVRESKLPGVYDDGTIDSTGKSEQRETYTDYSFHSTTSCPNTSWTTMDHAGDYCVRDYRDGAQQSHKSQVQSENSYYKEKVKGLGLHRDGTTIWPDGSISASFECSSAVPQEGARASWSNKPTEDVESEVRRLKLELTQAMDMYNNVCQEAINAEQQVSTRMGSEKVTAEEAQLTKQAGIKLADREKEGCKVLVEPAQAAPRQKVMEIEEEKTSRDQKLGQDMIQGRTFVDRLLTDNRYMKYTFKEIQQATDNFSDELKIGEGGYGPVFKASLDHTTVAIKILRSDASQGAKQFQQEIEVLSYIRHPNMVLLLGACPEYGCLVYEYMANGSLEDRLFCRSNTAPLSWQLRFKIAAEIATGLLSLHQTKPEPLVHRDLKPGNILLDHNFVSKIADVGLARLVPPSVADAVTQYCMTAAAGTFCYIDPEYQQTGMLGTKSDIYALGIILLQLVTGAQPMGLAHTVERALVEGRFGSMLDPNVPDWPMEETLRFTKVALKCAELRKKDRPELATVVLPALNRLREMAERSPISSSGIHRPRG